MRDVPDERSIGVKRLLVPSVCAFESDDTLAETKFRLWAKRTSPFISARVSVQSTTGSRGVRISGSNAGYTMFWGSMKSTGYPLHSPVSPSLPSRASPCAITFHTFSLHNKPAVYKQAVTSLTLLATSVKAIRLWQENVFVKRTLVKRLKPACHLVAVYQSLVTCHWVKLTPATANAIL
jgi:hypothetical protein